MGIGGIGIWQLLILLAIVLLVFGTKRLRNLGGDLGSAIKGFRSAMKESDDNASDAEAGKAAGERPVYEPMSDATQDADSPNEAEQRDRRANTGDRER